MWVWPNENFCFKPYCRCFPLKTDIFTARSEFFALLSWLIDRDKRNDGIENGWKVYLNVEKITQITDWLQHFIYKKYWLLSIKYRYLYVRSCFISAVVAAASWRAATAWFISTSTEKLLICWMGWLYGNLLWWTVAFKLVTLYTLNDLRFKHLSLCT